MKFVKGVPRNPGVYVFRNKNGKFLYIGKAANLRARLRSYFPAGADRPAFAEASAGRRGSKRKMLRDATRITWQITRSPIEALILEAQLIKKYQPKYNVLLRDDKQYFYVGFTKEKFPRVFLTHQLTISSHKPYAVSRKHKAYGLRPTAEYVGPFTDGRAIKRVIKLLRHAFPYCTHRVIPKRCLWQDLGLCPLGKSDRPDRTYRSNILAIKAVLNGKRQGLLRRLKKEMTAAAKKEEFERAAKLRDQVTSLENIFEHRDFLSESNIPYALRNALPQKPLGQWRIEGYDTSNIQGTSATGSMITFIGLQPAKEWYRKFRIKTVRGANDIAMLKEVIDRRLLHPEWAMPDIMLIDGGRPQLNAALAAINHSQSLKPYAISRKHKPTAYSLRPIAVIGLAKRREELYIPGRSIPIRLPKNHPLRLLLMHVRDEAHRFAHSYHQKRRALSLLS